VRASQSIDEEFSNLDELPELTAAGNDAFNVTWVSEDDCLVYGEYYDNGPDNHYVYRSTRAP
jgi:hypothetical protein